MTRNYTIPKIKNIDELVKEMDYPYSFIGNQYSGYPVDYILRPICMDKKPADPGDFPHNIEEHYWIRPGANDTDDWISMGKLKNGSYFLYTASCDYTGFDCQGGMCLWVSSSWESIIDHAMDEIVYMIYEEEMQ